ncbi:hypothetical protein QYM36_007679 [Artemia franciscana]|uniref:Ubiquitin carboxyl-terminal hydrolase MINDY n=1 Tax=Artemia franciscana TaxID=6661 RepID=A0AA88I9R6_ARTSF|nr:hypothetical protein QYM36_007679 [Artemia franciscana]
MWNFAFSARRQITGFSFSKQCPAALVQETGGPCSMLAPLQAFLLKNLWYMCGTFEASEETVEVAFVKALEEILIQACSNHQLVTVVSLEDNTEGDATRTANNEIETDIHSFQSRLVIEEIKIPELNKKLSHCVRHLKSKFGILCFLYSVILTRGIEVLQEDMAESCEPLIEPVHAHGSQALINLFITGRAVTNVWNGDVNIEGFILKGIVEQSSIGYLSLMEHLKYLSVGSYLKSPLNPVWVISSETHLTVVFSPDKKLVSEETPCEKAFRIFQSFNPDGDKFISSDMLGNVLREIGLESDPNYVALMKTKLDPEGLGVILLPAFMDEYFPKRTRSVPDKFEIYHWNGLSKSNKDGVVTLKHGIALTTESDLNYKDDLDRLKVVLRTKWQSIELLWDSVLPLID